MTPNAEANALATLPPLPPLPPEIEALSAKPYPSAPPGWIIRAIIGLRKKIQALADLFLPADVVLFERVVGVAHTQLIGAAARHRIADLLADGPLSTAEIAARIGADPDVTHRLLRALATTGIFTLHSDGRCQNNKISSALKSNRLSAGRDFAEYFSSKSNSDAWGDFDRSLKSGKSSFARVHGMSVWDWFDAHPDERETFARAMMGITVADAPVVANLYPWKEVKRGVRRGRLSAARSCRSC